MAEVTLNIGGRPHLIGCGEGQESRVRLLGAMLDKRWPGANRAAGGMSVERAMLFVALMLADDLDEAEHRPPEGAAVSETALARIADRLEALAQALEPVEPYETGPYKDDKAIDPLEQSPHTS